jgi:S1-C subfamily serine protease
MSNSIRVFVIAATCSTMFAQQIPNKLLSHQEICQRYTDSVVRIDTGRPSSATGFIISPDGWILTAAHVVIDFVPEKVKVDEGIRVTLSDGSVKIASQVLPLEPDLAGRDFALLKIETALKLPYIDLGDEPLGPQDVAVGSNVTFIGFPLNAVAFKSNTPSVKEKFCLSGQIAYSGKTNVGVGVNTPKGPGTVNVAVNIVYFQGPSIRGLSGAPIISDETGHVIAILTSKLTGIGDGLVDVRKKFSQIGNAGISVGGVHEEDAIASLIDTLDAQLVNGLGAGTGIEDPRIAWHNILPKPKTGTEK